MKDTFCVANFVRPHLLEVAGYVPGEQPQGGKFIKLNTNENPAITQSSGGRFGPGRTFAEVPRPFGDCLSPNGGSGPRRFVRSNRVWQRQRRNIGDDRPFVPRTGRLGSLGETNLSFV
jgi:hypothetical protein